MSWTEDNTGGPGNVTAGLLPPAASPPPPDYRGPEDDPGKAWRDYYLRVGILDEAFRAMAQHFLDEIDTACATLADREVPKSTDRPQQRQSGNEGYASQDRLARQTRTIRR